jgi:hypothetical protein
VLRDLAALAAPLIVAAAFVTGVVLFLSKQLGSRRETADEDSEAGIPDDTGNDDPADPGFGPSADQRNV